MLTCTHSHKKLAFREHQLWGFSITTLSSFHTKFRFSMFTKCQFLVRDGVLIFWGSPQGILTNCEYSQEWCWPMLTTMAFVGTCHTFCLPKFGHQVLNCPSIRYIVPAKIFPALSLCQKNWFCGKLRLDDFYPLLRSIVSSWINTGVKRISQACCLHHLKHMEKKGKTQL